MPENERKLRRLVIKAFHIEEVTEAEDFSIYEENLTISMGLLDNFITSEELIKEVNVDIIPPGEHDRWTNSIMDIIPISTKVLGDIGEGITHTLTGVYMILTGVDETGQQVSEFGSSEGNLQDKVHLNRAGTPSEDDFIISFNVTLKEGAGHSRPGPAAAHRICDKFIQQIRDELKELDGRKCTEKHEFHDKIRSGKKKVAIVKQIAGQGAMHDNLILPREPGGYQGGRSIIDMNNVPIILSPNEYRDGAIRAMT